MTTICVAGKNNIAVDVLLFCKKKYGDSNRIVCVCNRNDSGINSWQKSLAWFAQKNGIDILSLDEVEKISDLVFLSLEFDRIIRPERFKSNRLFNIHFSLLPKYKGMYPSVMPILNGESQTGVTLHRMERGIDTGAIIEQRTVDINPSDDSFIVYSKLISVGTCLVEDNIDGILNGNVSERRQPVWGSTYNSVNAINYSEICLDVNLTAFQVANQIRAFCFRPYQILTWKGVKYYDYELTDSISTISPGKILYDDELKTKISTIDYDIILYKDCLELLFNSIRNDDIDTMKEICKSKKIINSKDAHGWTPLIVAVYNNKKEAVYYLIDCGADINVVNNNGTNLLMYAKDTFMNTGDSTLFEFLYNKGLDMHLCDYEGYDVVHYSAAHDIRKIGNIILL